ncbi:hypothetical protein FGB62_281g015 [Gracilaria domingensis]|nr:hypothetical protein FGB62_281g015 [Gracilaria domingensis]
MPMRKRILSALRPVSQRSSSCGTASSPRASDASASRKLRHRRSNNDPAAKPIPKPNRSGALQKIVGFASFDKKQQSQLPQHKLEKGRSQRHVTPDRIVRPIAAGPNGSSLCAPHEPRVNDGYVSFVVPSNWCTSHIADCFSLFCGPCVGYVRAVHANLASTALLDTARLQIISEVAALSSPVFISNREISVDYVSAGGFGKGVAAFHHGFDVGAVVFAVCGPYEHRKQLLNAVEELRRTARVLAVPASAMLASDMITSHQSYRTADTNCRMQ